MTVTPGSDHFFTRREPPIDARIVVVDTGHCVLLRPRPARHPVVELPLLCVNRHPSGEQFESAGVVVVQVTQRDRVDRVDVDPDLIERLSDRLSVGHEDRQILDARVKPLVQRRVTDERRIEAGVEQHPAAVTLQEHSRNRLPHPHLGRRSVNGDGLGQILPAEGQQDDAPDSRAHQPTDNLASIRVFGLDTMCASSTPFSQGCATMKSVTLTMLSQHPVAEACCAASE